MCTCIKCVPLSLSVYPAAACLLLLHFIWPTCIHLSINSVRVRACYITLSTCAHICTRTKKFFQGMQMDVAVPKVVSTEFKLPTTLNTNVHHCSAVQGSLQSPRNVS